MSIGNNIRKLRELKNYTQEYMAERLGMSIAAYGRIERNESDISHARMQQIAKEFSVPIYLLHESPDKFIFQLEGKSRQGGYCNHCEQNKETQKLIIEIFQNVSNQLEIQNSLIETIISFIKRNENKTKIAFLLIFLIIK